MADIPTVSKIDLEDISDYVADFMGREMLAFDINIRFNDETLTSIGDVKMLAKAIVDMVEDGDGYSWV